MLHLNNILRSSVTGSLVDLILPESYLIENIKDFIDNKNSLVTTPYFKILMFPAFAYVGSTVILAKNVNLRFTKGKNYQLYDMSGELDLREENHRIWAHHTSAYLENLQEGRYSEAMLRYYPKKDHLILQTVKNPPKPKKVKDYDFGLVKPKFAFCKI